MCKIATCSLNKCPLENCLNWNGTVESLKSCRRRGKFWGLWFFFAYSWWCNFADDRFSVSVRKELFLNMVSSRMLIRGRGLPMNTKQIVSLWILMTSQYACRNIYRYNNQREPYFYHDSRLLQDYVGYGFSHHYYFLIDLTVIDTFIWLIFSERFFLLATILKVKRMKLPLLATNVTKCYVRVYRNNPNILIKAGFNICIFSFKEC